MARPFWKGSISFGLVEIPVTLRPAVRKEEMSFSLLDRKDFSPVGYRRYNKTSGEEVEWDRIVRGYEYEPDEYVVLSDEEIRRANVEASQTVEILEFVEQSEIDPMYFDTAYYVEPLKRGSKSYALLRATLERTGKAAVARVVLRTRQHLAALTVKDSVLVLNLMHYAHELVPSTEIEVSASAKGSARPTEAEVKMAERLVEGMTGHWQPAKFRDDYRDDLMSLIEKKVKSGKTHTILEPKADARERPRKEVVDLMPLLKKSLEKRAGAGAGSRSRPARAAARSKRAAPKSRHKKSA